MTDEWQAISGQWEGSREVNELVADLLVVASAKSSSIVTHARRRSPRCYVFDGQRAAPSLEVMRLPLPPHTAHN